MTRLPQLRSGIILAAALMLLIAGCRATADDAVVPDVVEEQTETEPDTETAAQPEEPPVYSQADAPIADRVDDLLERMTLEEKVGQMTLVQKNALATVDLANMSLGGLLSGGGGSPLENTPEAWAEMVTEFQAESLESRLGIPLLYGVDAVHGHSNVRGTVIFPHNIGLGAANDSELMERIGHVTAVETIATSIHWNYAPAVSVPQDIRWGRTYEGYSEDTARVTELSAAYLRGLQGTDLAAADTVLATPKHYVGDGGTVWGTSGTSGYWIDQGITEVDEAELRAVHLPPFERAIADGAMSIMASYSSWGGEKMHAQQYLLTDVLKGELGFDGFVVSDWAAIDQISDDYREAVVRSINAGIDMNMVPDDYRRFVSTLVGAVEAGDVSQERIDDAVRRILAVKFALGLFEQPYGDADLLGLVGSDEHRAVAREAVAKSQVLLRNDADLLPFDPEMPRLYVAGAAADDIGLQSGGWTIEWQGGRGLITEGTTILDGIRAAVSESTEVIYDRSGEFEPADNTTESMVCLAAVGEEPYAEGMGDDGNPTLSDTQMMMLDNLATTCEQLAVVVVSGRPLLVSSHVELWDAMVAAWLPGSEGAGVADVLFGAQPFTGTLPYTWPRTVEQLGTRPSDMVDPLFPFGFGLSAP